MKGEQLGTPIEGRVIDQVVIEAAESCAVTAMQVSGLEPIAQLAVDHEFVGIADDRAREFQELALQPYRDEAG